MNLEQQLRNDARAQRVASRAARKENSTLPNPAQETSSTNPARDSPTTSPRREPSDDSNDSEREDSIKQESEPKENNSGSEADYDPEFLINTTEMADNPGPVPPVP